MDETLQRRVKPSASARRRSSTTRRRSFLHSTPKPEHETPRSLINEVRSFGSAFGTPIFLTPKVPVPEKPTNEQSSSSSEPVISRPGPSNKKDIFDLSSSEENFEVRRKNSSGIFQSIQEIRPQNEGIRPFRRGVPKSFNFHLTPKQDAQVQTSSPEATTNKKPIRKIKKAINKSREVSTQTSPQIGERTFGVINCVGEKSTENRIDEREPSTSNEVFNSASQPVDLTFKKIESGAPEPIEVPIDECEPSTSKEVSSSLSKPMDLTKKPERETIEPVEEENAPFSFMGHVGSNRKQNLAVTPETSKTLKPKLLLFNMSSSSSGDSIFGETVNDIIDKVLTPSSPNRPGTSSTFQKSVHFDPVTINDEQKQLSENLITDTGKKLLDKENIAPLPSNVETAASTSKLKENPKPNVVSNLKRKLPKSPNRKDLSPGASKASCSKKQIVTRSNVETTASTSKLKENPKPTVVSKLKRKLPKSPNRKDLSPAGSKASCSNEQIATRSNVETATTSKLREKRKPSVVSTKLKRNRKPPESLNRPDLSPTRSKASCSNEQTVKSFQLSAAQKRKYANLEKDSLLSNQEILDAFSYFYKNEVSEDLLPVLQDASEKFYKQMVTDLKCFAKHAGRKNVDESDMVLLLKRQRHVTESVSADALLEEYLSLEARRELFGVAIEGNEVRQE